MADLITRLLLNTQQFDNNLGKSSKQIQGFQSKIQGFSSNAIGAFTKFAGGVGLAMGGLEAFNKTINSTQTTGDAFQKIIIQSTASVESFFTSIAKGNFSGFINNLQHIINKAGELAGVLDELGTKSLFTNAELNALMNEKKMYENIAKDRSKSDKERNEALEKSRQKQLEINKLQNELAKQNKEAALAKAQSAMANGGYSGIFTQKDWEYFSKESNRSEYTEKGNKYKELEKQSKATTNSGGGGVTGQGISIKTKESQLAEKELTNWLKTADGRRAQQAAIFIELADDDKSAIAEALGYKKTYEDMIGSISDSTLELNNIGAKINGSYKSNNKSTSSKTEEIIPEGSMAYLDKQIAAKSKELAYATSNEARITIQQEIDKLVEDKRIMTFWYELKPIDTSTGEDFDAMENEVENSIKPIDIKENDIKTNNDYTESLQGIASVMGSITNSVEGGAAAWLSWGANLMTAIGAAIPQIQALTAANKAEANSSTIQAGANVAKEGSKLGPFGWISAIAGIAAIFAAIASAPKFADGGVFSGNSFIGDNMIARVNSGEMILNNRQQRNLFNLLDGKSSTSSLNGGNVEFTIRGKELVGVLNAYTNKTSKYK